MFLELYFLVKLTNKMLSSFVKVMIIAHSNSKIYLQGIFFLVDEFSRLKIFIFYKFAVTPAFIYLEFSLVLFYYIFFWVVGVK